MCTFIVTMSTIAAKQDRLRALRRQVRWHRRAAVVLLVVGLVVVLGYLAYRGETPVSDTRIESER